jgi:hypothetical protein
MYDPTVKTEFFGMHWKKSSTLHSKISNKNNDHEKLGFLESRFGYIIREIYQKLLSLPASIEGIRKMNPPNEKTKTTPLIVRVVFGVPKEGIEPTLPKEHEFESCASACSATSASDNPATPSKVKWTYFNENLPRVKDMICGNIGNRLEFL